MFTSDTKQNKHHYLQIITAYLIITLFTAFFGAVYELFSHEVYSYCMLYAFAFPLAGGVLPFFLLMKHKKAYPPSFATGSYHAGIATLTTGSVLTGALEIYGTTNLLTNVYWVLGGTMLFVGIAAYLIAGFAMQKMKEKKTAQVTD